MIALILEIILWACVIGGLAGWILFGDGPGGDGGGW